jgi:hypothetical protein
VTSPKNWFEKFSIWLGSDSQSALAGGQVVQGLHVFPVFWLQSPQEPLEQLEQDMGYAVKCLTRIWVSGLCAFSCSERKISLTLA